MNTSNIIVYSIVILILVIVFVGIVNYMVPFYKKIELNALGRTYFNTIEVNQGLSLDQINALKAKLLSRGFENTNIQCTRKGTAKFNETLSINIECAYTYYEIQISNTAFIFAIKKVSLPMRYHSQVLNRKIEE